MIFYIYLSVSVYTERIEEDGVLTDCSIKTLEPDEILDFNFCSTNVINKIIMKSECLKIINSWNSPSWMKALACTHLESSTVTLNPIELANTVAVSLKWTALRILDTCLALSIFANSTYPSSLSLRQKTGHFLINRTMALSTQQADNDEGYVLLAKIDNARHVSNILKAVHFKETNNQFLNKFQL
jgi:hypothetical protein